MVEGLEKKCSEIGGLGQGKVFANFRQGVSLLMHFKIYLPKDLQGFENL
jgi:hypothetical protein